MNLSQAEDVKDQLKTALNAKKVARNLKLKIKRRSARSRTFVKNTSLTAPKRNRQVYEKVLSKAKLAVLEEEKKLLIKSDISPANKTEEDQEESVGDCSIEENGQMNMNTSPAGISKRQILTNNKIQGDVTINFMNFEKKKKKHKLEVTESKKKIRESKEVKNNKNKNTVEERFKKQFVSFS